MPEVDTGKKASQNQAIVVKFVQKPQDARADTVVDLSIAPSFILYNAKTLERVQEFFHTEEVTPPHLHVAMSKPQDKPQSSTKSSPQMWQKEGWA